MKKDILKKYLNNGCTNEELEEVITWVNIEGLNKESENWGLENWNNFRVEDGIGDDKKFEILFDKILQRIDGDGKKKYPLAPFQNKK